jgi:hypothetical protein
VGISLEFPAAAALGDGLHKRKSKAMSLVTAHCDLKKKPTITGVMVSSALPGLGFWLGCSFTLCHVANKASGG